MPWVILGMGLLLAGGGGAAIVLGYPYMQIEFGWTEVIAGSAALAGGVVTIALAGVASSLARLRRSVERCASMREAQEVAADPVPAPAATAESGADTVAPAQPAPAMALPQGDPEPALPESSGPAWREHSLIASASLSSREIPRAAAPPLASPDRPAIAGRYESGGSSYVLYADGSIEVDSETGRHRFHSMEDLKAFMGQSHPEGVAAPSVG